MDFVAMFTFPKCMDLYPMLAARAASPIVKVRCGANGKFGVHSVGSEQPKLQISAYFKGNSNRPKRITKQEKGNKYIKNKENYKVKSRKTKVAIK